MESKSNATIDDLRQATLNDIEDAFKTFMRKNGSTPENLRTLVSSIENSLLFKVDGREIIIRIYQTLPQSGKDCFIQLLADRNVPPDTAKRFLSETGLID